MYCPKKELIFSILQFLKKEKYRETLHKLEQESKIFFNQKYFKKIVTNGEWEKAEKYLSAFTKLDDNIYSTKMFFRMRRQKYLEALDRNNYAKAANILWNDFKVFSTFQDTIYEQLAELFALRNFRENKHLSGNFDTTSERTSLLDEFKTLAERNPSLQDKLMFPNMEESRLWTLMLTLRLNPEQRARIIKASVSDTIASLHRELIFIVLQFLDEEKLIGTLHELEQESKIFFNMNYFEECVINGEWDKSEKYLSAFTKLDDNKYSLKMFFEIRKHKYLEALDRNDHHEAVNILWKDLEVFKAFSDNIYVELAELFCLKNIRQNKFLSTYDDVASTRARLSDHLKTFVNRHPILQDKLNLWNDYRANFMPNAYMGTILVDNTRVSSHLANVNFGVGVKSSEKSPIWKLTVIKELSQCCTLVLPDESLPGRVARLIYSHYGDSILGLTHNAMHKHWKGKANAIVQPKLFQLSSEINANLENAVPSFALTKNDSYLLSSSGGTISLFILETFKTLGTVTLPPSPAATYLAILPRDNNITAIGYEDSSIKIYRLYTNEVKANLKGHQKQITCLAFSDKLNVLVSSGADAQLCVWSSNNWEKKGSRFMQTPSGQVLDPPIINHIEFHKDQIQLLAVHERQIDIYAAPKLQPLKQLALQEPSHPITHATYSCDGQSIYVCFKNGSVAVYVDTTLGLRCLINLTAYTQPDPSMEVYPLVIAAHPSEPNQFALGLTNGRVHVLEPLESEGEWGTPPPLKDGDTASTQRWRQPEQLKAFGI